MFAVTSIIKNNDKEKYVYSSCRIAYDGKDERSFGNEFARNVIIFEFDSSSSSHTGSIKNGFLIYGKEDTFGINGSFGAPEKKLDINFS